MSLSKLERSQKAHERLRWKYSSLHKKHIYHLDCIRKQNRENRVLTKEERKKIWNSVETPW